MHPECSFERRGSILCQNHILAMFQVASFDVQKVLADEEYVGGQSDQFAHKTYDHSSGSTSSAL